MYVCMYVCMYVYIHICIYVYIHVLGFQNCLPGKMSKYRAVLRRSRALEILATKFYYSHVTVGRFFWVELDFFCKTYFHSQNICFHIADTMYFSKHKFSDFRRHRKRTTPDFWDPEMIVRSGGRWWRGGGAQGEATLKAGLRAPGSRPWGLACQVCVFHCDLKACLSLVPAARMSSCD